MDDINIKVRDRVRESAKKIGAYVDDINSDDFDPEFNGLRPDGWYDENMLFALAEALTVAEEK